MEAPSTSPEAKPETRRSEVLSLQIKEKSALYAAYMPFVKHGGLFIPSSRAMKLGEEVFLLLSLMDDPQKHPVQGKVVWLNPPGINGRSQGFGVEFAESEAGREVRAKIEKFLAGALTSNRPTQTL